MGFTQDFLFFFCYRALYRYIICESKNIFKIFFKYYACLHLLNIVVQYCFVSRYYSTPIFSTASGTSTRYERYSVDDTFSRMSPLRYSWPAEVRDKKLLHVMRKSHGRRSAIGWAACQPIADRPPCDFHVSSRQSDAVYNRLKSSSFRFSSNHLFI